MNIAVKPVVLGIADKQPTAIRFALREAKLRGTTLRIVHSAVVPSQGAEFSVSQEMYDQLWRAEEAVLDDARHFVEQEPSPSHVDYVLSAQAPVDILEQEARAAQLLVIGVDDISWWDRVFGGAIAGYLANHAACPVIAVPESTFPTTAHRGVVVTLDGDTSATGPLQFAFDQASARGNHLHVLHATPPGTVASDTEASRANIAEVLAGWKERYPDVRLTRQFVMGEPGDQCRRATAHAELVVVGRPHHKSAVFAITHPVASQVLRGAQCPVAVVPSDFSTA